MERASLTKAVSEPGSVVFGGIDTKRYKGSFIKLPIIPAAESPDGNTRFWIYLDGISVNQPDGDVIGVFSKPDGEKGQPVLLDSGYTLSALPRPIMQKLVAAFPSAQYDSGSNTYIVDCADVGRGGSLDFTFGWKTINVPYDEFIWRPSSNTCILGAFEDGEWLWTTAPREFIRHTQTLSSITDMNDSYARLPCSW